MVETDSGGPPEKGLYGTPTLPDGTRDGVAPEGRAGLRPAVAGAARAATYRSRIAAADYPGWQRWIRSSATLREQNYGTRFVPARPTVTVYDGQGKLLRRFGPELFPRPLWVDLGFCRRRQVPAGLPPSLDLSRPGRTDHSARG